MQATTAVIIDFKSVDYIDESGVLVLKDVSVITMELWKLRFFSSSSSDSSFENEWVSCTLGPGRS